MSPPRSYSGRAVRSYVGIPDTGCNRRCYGPAHVLDLSRVSTEAARIHVPKTLKNTPGLTTNVIPELSNTPKKKRRSSEVEYQGQRTPNVCNITNTKASISSLHNKSTGDNIITSNGSHISGSTVPSEKINHNISSTAVKMIPVKLIATSLLSNATTATLKSENIELRQENSNLRRQLAIFKQLIRNPERLRSVLIRLNIPFNPYGFKRCRA
ncbi:unnamed protein product [Meganyctiphanes norvegica]|uniref:Uncharacterized protein n=1 Tax=Meganyctiphanes norvegica TaxID=48144 RepID=A0AAV2QAZ0_MEGNR